MKGAVGNLESSQHCSKIYCDFSKCKKEKKKNHYEGLLGEKIFVAMDRIKILPNKINAFGKRCVIPGRGLFLFPCSLVFVHAVYQAVSSLLFIFPAIKDTCIEYILWVGLLSESSLKIKVFYLYYLNSKACTSKIGLLASFFRE